MKRTTRSCLGRKDTIRVSCFVFSFFLFYLYVFNKSGPPEYLQEKVERYALTDANSFYMVPFYKESTHERVRNSISHFHYSTHLLPPSPRFTF